jgi:hypothetical protein
MAKISGQSVKTEISTDAGTTWKELICETTSGSDLTRETTTAPFTKCDVATAAQEVTPLASSWSFNFDALTDTAPSGSQVTYSDMLTLWNTGASFSVRRQYNTSGSEFYLSGTAYLTSLSEVAPADGFHSFSGTITGSGALDINPAA